MSFSKSESKTDKEKKHSKDKKDKKKLKLEKEFNSAQSSFDDLRPLNSNSSLTKRKSSSLAIKKDNKKSEGSDSNEHSKDPSRRASLAVISTSKSGRVYFIQLN
jgi:hypothetical protein